MPRPGNWPFPPIMWHLGTHKQESIQYTVASLNHIWLLCQNYLSTYKWCFLCNQGFDQFVNVFRNRWPVERAKRDLRKIKYDVRMQKEKESSERILRRILIVSHAVLAFLRETSRCHRLSLLQRFAFLVG
jgi:hypothetical protein